MATPREEQERVSHRLSALHKTHEDAPLPLHDYEITLSRIDGAFVALQEPGFKWRPFGQLWESTVKHAYDRVHQHVLHQHESKKHGKTLKLRQLPAKLARSSVETVRFYRHNYLVFQREVLCGMAATLLQIPETVAFSYVANLDPLVGLYATGFLGVIVGLLGGVPATIAGAAGALAVVMPQLTSNTGDLAHLSYEERLVHLNVAIFLVGIFQLLCALLGVTKLVSMIPRTAHIGFLNGLAIMMFVSQMTTFKQCKADDQDLKFGMCEARGALEWMSLADPRFWTTSWTVLMTMLIMHFFPKVPKIGKLIPPTLVVALVGIGFEFGINRPLIGANVRTIGDTSRIAGGFPHFQMPAFPQVQAWGPVISCAASLSAVGIFESIMTLQAVVDLTKNQLTERACRQECFAQGLSNLVCSFFRAMGGCSMIGQSTGNVINGARHRLSAVVGGIVMFLVILCASPAIELVPVACLTGILFVIILHTFYWPSLQLIFRMQLTDAIAVVLVTSLAAAINLAVAVIAGVIWQALVISWSAGSDLQVVNYEGARRLEVQIINGSLVHVTAKVYRLHGNLLFTSIARFRTMFTVEDDPDYVLLDCSEMECKDFSAVAALRELIGRYAEENKTCVLEHVQPYSRDLIIQHDLGWALLHEPLIIKRSTSVTKIRPESEEADELSGSTPSTPSSTYHRLQE